MLELSITLLEAGIRWFLLLSRFAETLGLDGQ
jgi:hypothetical protein